MGATATENYSEVAVTLMTTPFRVLSSLARLFACAGFLSHPPSGGWQILATHMWWEWECGNYSSSGVTQRHIVISAYERQLKLTSC